MHSEDGRSKYYISIDMKCITYCVVWALRRLPEITGNQLDITTSWWQSRDLARDVSNILMNDGPGSMCNINYCGKCLYHPDMLLISEIRSIMETAEKRIHCSIYIRDANETLLGQWVALSPLCTHSTISKKKDWDMQSHVLVCFIYYKREFLILSLAKETNHHIRNLIYHQEFDLSSRTILSNLK